MLSALAAISATVTLALIGAMAGLFFAFSVSVMLGLDAIKPVEAIRAMQSINRKIQNPVFLATFVIAPIAALITGALLLALNASWAGVLFFGAGAVYVLGAIVPTAVLNVPMNNALDQSEVPADEHEAAQLWSDYSVRWTQWNTARAALNTLSLLLVGLALFVWGRHG